MKIRQAKKLWLLPFNRVWDCENDRFFNRPSMMKALRKLVHNGKTRDKYVGLLAKYEKK